MKVGLWRTGKNEKFFRETRSSHLSNALHTILGDNIYGNTMTDREKVIQYEALLHMIQMHAQVTMNPEKISKLISNICNWSYAHRVGNGEYSDEKQQSIIKRNFDKLLDC